MKSSWTLFFVLLLGNATAPALDDEPNAVVSEAVRQLADGSNYSWKTTTHNEGGGPAGGDSSVTGMMVKDGYALVSSKSQGGFEFVRKVDKTAVLFDGLWMTADQAAGRSRASSGGGPFGGGFNPGLIT